MLAWLLPALAFLVAAGVLWRAADRMRMGIRLVWVIVAAGTAVGAVGLLGNIAASQGDRDTLNGALLAAAWRVVAPSFWRVAAVTVLAGGLLVGAATVAVPDASLATQARALLRCFVQPPPGRWPRIARGTLGVAAGLVVLLQPALVLRLLAGSAALLFIGWGVGEFATAARTERARPARSHAPGGSRLRPRPTVVAGTALALLVGVVLVDAAPATRDAGTLTTSGTACNGHQELCSRPYDQVAFPATHNAMSAVDGPGWFLPEQPTGIIGQLDAGIRVLLIDSWYGQPTQRPNLVVTAPGSHASALAEAERQFGPAAVNSALRLAQAGTATPTGPPRPYLCHGLCEIGATDWEPVMAEVHTWLAKHPREVVTFFVEDSVTPEDTAGVFDRAGLLPFVHTQASGQPWPTLGQMIDSGRRLVVLMERHAGGAKYPWLLPGFSATQDTPFTNRTANDLSCARKRGTATSPLLLLNYWLSGFRSLVTDARAINQENVLWPYVSRCRQERGQIPNYVAVNFYNEGALFAVVDRLNGVP
ncbi:MAG TPA: hypothetical protein VLR26_00915 [Frankiaceae bacterium]|nr:hypothetical protein [Frankiaceae bacterium]